MLTAGFEPAILESERSQTYTLDSAVPGIGQTQRHLHKSELRLLQLIHIRNILISCDFGTGILYGTVYLYCSLPKGCTLVLRACEMRSVVYLKLNLTLIEEHVRKLQSSMVVKL